MKKKNKKLLAFILCLCMFVSLMPGVGAEEVAELEEQAAPVEEITEAPAEPAEEPAAELPEEQLPEEALNAEDTCELEEEVINADYDYSTIYWGFDASVGKLMISSRNKYTGYNSNGSMNGSFYCDETSGDYPGRWSNPAYLNSTSINDKISSVRSVVVEDTVAPKVLDSWFKNFVNCTSFDLAKLDTSRVTTYWGMFNTCTSVQELDLSNFTTPNAGLDAAVMFNGCTNLTTIKVGAGWDASKLTGYTSQMFTECTSLVGGAGTTVTGSNPTDGQYARIDGDGGPGYFTAAPGLTPSVEIVDSNNDVIWSTYKDTITQADFASNWTDGTTLRFLKDCTINQSASIDVSIGSTQNMELNGKTVTWNMASNVNFSIRNYGNLIISGGTESARGTINFNAIANSSPETVKYFVNFYDAGSGSVNSLIINNAIINATAGGNAFRGINIGKSGYYTTLNNVQITVNGCDTQYARAIQVTQGYANLSDCDIKVISKFKASASSGDSFALYFSGSGSQNVANVYSGTYECVAGEGTNYSVKPIWKSVSATVYLHGGSYRGDPTPLPYNGTTNPENTNPTIIEGYTKKADAERTGWYNIVPKTPTAQIIDDASGVAVWTTSNDSINVADLNANWTAGTTLKLLDDCTIIDEAASGGTTYTGLSFTNGEFSLDLNSKTLTYTKRATNAALFLEGNAVLNIRDSSGSRGTINFSYLSSTDSSTYMKFIYVDNGTADNSVNVENVIINASINNDNLSGKKFAVVYANSATGTEIKLKNADLNVTGTSASEAFGMVQINGNAELEDCNITVNSNVSTSGAFRFATSDKGAANITINSGNYSCTGSTDPIVNPYRTENKKQTHSTVTLNGGSFKGNPIPNSATLGTGCTIYADTPEQGWYTVDPGELALGASITPGETIYLNIYVNNISANKPLSEYTLECTVHEKGDGTRVISAALSDAEAVSSAQRRIAIPFAVKNCVDTVDIVLKHNGETFKDASTSIMSCCEVYADPDNNYSAKLQKFAAAMLEYVNSMQVYKKYKTDTPANANYKLTVDDLVSAVPAAYADSAYNGKSGTFTNIKVTGRSLSHEERTRMFIYVEAKNGKSIPDDFTFTCEGVQIQPELNPNQTRWYVPLPGFNAGEMDSVRTLQITDGTETYSVWYSPMNYAYKMQTGATQTDAKLGNVVMYMYNYFLCAQALFS